MQAIRQTSIHVAFNEAKAPNILNNELSTLAGKTMLFGTAFFSLFSMPFFAPTLLAADFVFGTICLAASHALVGTICFLYGIAATRNYIRQSVE